MWFITKFKEIFLLQRLNYYLELFPFKGTNYKLLLSQNVFSKIDLIRIEKRLGRWIYINVRVVFFALLYMCGTGCENVFEPLQENDRYAFSMYGTLDLQADTQWVRVMPIWESLIPRDPEPNGTKVTLIHQRSGEDTPMQPELFRFSNDVYVWNYWTNKQMEPQEKYIVRAMAPDGRQSYATVTTPSFLPIPVITYSEEFEQGTVRGISEDRLVTMEIRYIVQAYVELGCAPETEIVISHIDDVSMNLNGEYHFHVNNNRVRIARELGVSASNFQVNKRELVVISASVDWPDIADLSDEVIVLPDVVSNVNNGTGVIAGIASRKVEITPKRDPC
jgi:hypothetical protein